MDYPKHLDAAFKRAVQDQNPLEARHSKNADASDLRVAELCVPAHLGLGGKQCKRVVRRHQEAVTKFRVCFYRVVKGLIVEVLIGLRANDVLGVGQRVPVRLSRSSSRRCFSSQ